MCKYLLPAFCIHDDNNDGLIERDLAFHIVMKYNEQKHERQKKNEKKVRQLLKHENKLKFIALHCIMP